jgi:Prealbumin-like fold domain
VCGRVGLADANRKEPMSLGTVRKRPIRRSWVIAVTTAAAAGLAAFFIASALGVLTGSPSKFEAGDGNMIVDTTGNNDWKTVSFTHVSDIASSQSDDSFVSGQKQDTVCPDAYNHGNPPKDDFTDVASFSETNTTTGHTYLYGATIRYTANGSASENVELKKGLNGTCANGLLARTVGDKLVAIDYTGGGSSVDVHVLTWIDGTDTNNPTCFVSNDTPPCWGAVVQHPTAVEGAASASNISAANNPISNAAIKAGQFAEFGVDLSASDVNIIPPGTCTAFPQTVWESRSSGSSFVSTTKDVAIENHTISNCGEIKIIKQTNPRGIDQVFNFSSNLPASSTAGGVACPTNSGVQTGGAFCLNDVGNSGKTLGSTADDQNSTGNTVRETNLPQGSYSITEGANPTGFAFGGVTCSGGTTTVDPNNSKHVTVTLAPGDVVVCVYQNNQQFGAIKVTKVSSKPAATALAGAHFRICTNDGPYTAQNPCAAAKTGSDDLTTASDGTVCIDHLGFTTYYVSEKSPPSGYAADDTTVHPVAVDNNAACDDTTYGGEAIQFADTPLTDLTITVSSEADGGTQSSIKCVTGAPAAFGTGTDIGNSPQPASGVDDPVTVTADGTSALRPGTYTCKVFIDP